MMRIRPMIPEDYPAVSAILTEGIHTPNVTFRTEAPDYAEWDAGHFPRLRFVAEDAGRVIGWVAASPVSGRACYRGVGELSVYVASSARGRGCGKALLQKLVEASEAEGLWTLEAHIFAENRVSVALHEKCGFRLVGYRERVGFDDRGVWHDTVLMERRSRTVKYRED